MSLLPSEEITYLDYVAEFFLAQKGAGLTLSPPDVELVRRYEGEGIPFEVLCRGIERAFEVRRRHGKERTPHLSLRSCRRSIDAEVRRHRKGAIRGAGPLADPRRLDRLLGLARTAPAKPIGLAYRAAYRAACSGDAVEPAAAPPASPGSASPRRSMPAAFASASEYTAARRSQRALAAWSIWRRPASASNQATVSLMPCAKLLTGVCQRARLQRAVRDRRLVAGPVRRLRLHRARRHPGRPRPHRRASKSGSR